MLTGPSASYVKQVTDDAGQPKVRWDILQTVNYSGNTISSHGLYSRIMTGFWRDKDQSSNLYALS